jgi:hypothetical protein
MLALTSKDENACVLVLEELQNVGLCKPAGCTSTNCRGDAWRRPVARSTEPLRGCVGLGEPMLISIWNKIVFSGAPGERRPPASTAPIRLQAHRLAEGNM